MGIALSNRQKQVAIDTRKITRTARKILSALGCRGQELSIVLTDDESIARLNRQYLQRPRPTNVLAFPMAGQDSPAIDSPLLGDVVISVETARREAVDSGKGTEDAVVFLLIHGILHLLGYDHEGSRKERQAMEAKEQELLSLIKSASHQKAKGKTRGRGETETR